MVARMENILRFFDTNHGIKRIVQRLGLKVRPIKENIPIFQKRISRHSLVISKESRLHKFLLEKSDIHYTKQSNIIYLMDIPTRTIHAFYVDKPTRGYIHITTLSKDYYLDDLIDNKTFEGKFNGVFKDSPI
jgi:hypothetical protein